MNKNIFFILIGIVFLLLISYGCVKTDNKQVTNEPSVKYTVAFDSDGGSDISQQRIEKGCNVIKPIDPIKIGYDFDGWYVDDEKWSFNGHVVTKDLTLKAKWKKSLFNIILNNDEITITGLNDTTVDEIIIPQKLWGYDVTSIELGSFNGCSNLEKITIPFIGDKLHLKTDRYQYPFGYIFGKTSYTGSNETNQYYYGLDTSDIISTTYYIPSSLKEVVITGCNYIPYGAFFGCVNLTNIIIPDDVTIIDIRAFSGCRSLSSIRIPDGVVDISYGLFEGCQGLTSVLIPNSVTTIGSFAFSGCGFEGITIPNSVTSIGFMAFSACSNLKDIIIPDSVTDMGNNTFYQCSSLTSITIGNGVTDIGESAFFECTKLKDITIGNSVKRINNYAFCECQSLGIIKLPNTVTIIGNGAFYDCKNLTGIIIPDSVTIIVSGAFQGCKKVTFACEAISKPSGWSSDWNSENRPVIWGYTE